MDFQAGLVEDTDIHKSKRLKIEKETEEASAISEQNTWAWKYHSLRIRFSELPRKQQWK